jgi:hypothetical protein
MAQYKDLYSGGDYVIHFKYAGLLNVAYITCMYGVGMPILFPIAAVNYLNQWVAERITVAYFMRLPPALDDKLTKNALDMLRYAPLLMLLNGYWMLSNKQIFQNAYSLKEKSGEHMKSGHVLHFDVNWATPVLLMCAASLLLLTAQKLFREKLTAWGFTM